VEDVYKAETSDAAWQSMRDFNPDVIFLDWMIDGASGIELVRLIRTSAASPNPFVPVIMMCGQTRPAQVIQARDAGCNEFLAKPVTVNGIMTRLISVIENPRPFVRTKSYFGPCRRRRELAQFGAVDRRTNKPNRPDTDVESFDAVA
jgi:DNA-binding response OmpR family regulator